MFLQLIRLGRFAQEVELDGTKGILPLSLLGLAFGVDVLQNADDNLREVERIHRGDDGAARFLFDLLARIAGDCSAPAGNVAVFLETNRLLSSRNLCRGGFREHVKHQLGIAHVVAQVFARQTLEIFVFARAHARSTRGKSRR